SEKNQIKPPASSTSPAAVIAMVKKPIQRAKAASILVNRLKRTIDRVARGQGGHERDQKTLPENRCIAGDADRKRAEQGRTLVSTGAAAEPIAQHAGNDEQKDRCTAADTPALQSEHQKMALEVAG